MLTRTNHSIACLLLMSAATLACPSNESFESLGDTPATTTATTAASDPATGSTTAPTSSSTTDTSTTDTSTTATSTTDDTTTDDTNTADTTGTTGEPMNVCPDHMATDACCCFEVSTGGVSSVCGTKSLCDTAEFECDESGDTCTAVAEPAVDCVLEALRDGTMAGSLKVDYDIGEGYGRRKLELYLQGDGSAYVIDAEELDLGGISRPTGRHTLREAAYFETCLMGDVQAKADCLENVLGGKPSEVCTDEFSYDLR